MVIACSLTGGVVCFPTAGIVWGFRKSPRSAQVHISIRRDLKGRAGGVHIERVTDIALDRHLDETVDDLWTLWQRILGGSDRRGLLDPPRFGPD